MSSVIDQLSTVVEAAQRGDPSAWAILVERFEDFAVAVAMGRGGDWDGARDVAQDAFLLAVSRIDELQDPAAPRVLAPPKTAPRPSGW